MFYAVTAQGQDQGLKQPGENVLQQYSDGSIVVEVSYEKKSFDKALRTLIYKGIKPRKISRVDISVPQGHMYFIVKPILDGNVTYYVYDPEGDNYSGKPIYHSTKVEEVRKYLFKYSKLLIDNI